MLTARNVTELEQQKADSVELLYLAQDATPDKATARSVMALELITERISHALNARPEEE